jgi:hypothetical protein
VRLLPLPDVPDQSCEQPKLLPTASVELEVARREGNANYVERLR